MRLTHLANVVLRALIPFSSELRRIKRRFRPYEELRVNDEMCITNGLEQLAALRGWGINVRGAQVLEFGSGWLPLIPLLFHVAGAKRLILTDIERLMDSHTLAVAREVLTERVHEVAQTLGETESNVLRGLHDPFPHDYLVPWDAAAHPSSSVDIVISRAVLEHIPELRLPFFFGQFHRILRPGGVMCHVVDNSDHWQHHDPRLGRVEFLRYEEDDLIWRLAQLNVQMFQNRLRHKEYEGLMREAGFEVVQSTGEVNRQCLADIDRLPLARRFQNRDETLAILTSFFVARRLR